jgi:hypothetical protein
MMCVLLAPTPPDTTPPPPPCPLLASTQELAVTPLSADSRLGPDSLHPAASVSTSPLSQNAPHFISRGRAKVERWKDDGSLVSSPGDPLPVKFPTLSFQDALLAHRALTVELAMAGTVVITPVDPPAPRSQAASDVHAAAPSHSKEEGWQLVESQKSRRRWFKAARVRRPISADLADRCFNCFSASHFPA